MADPPPPSYDDAITSNYSSPPPPVLQTPPSFAFDASTLPLSELKRPVTHPSSSSLGPHQEGLHRQNSESSNRYIEVACIFLIFVLVAGTVCALAFIFKAIGGHL